MGLNIHHNMMFLLCINYTFLSRIRWRQNLRAFCLQLWQLKMDSNAVGTFSDSAFACLLTNFISVVNCAQFYDIFPSHFCCCFLCRSFFGLNPFLRPTFACSMSYTFGKLLHLAIIWAIWKAHPVMRHHFC